MNGRGKTENGDRETADVRNSGVGKRRRFSDPLSLKSFDFSVRCINLYKYLISEHKEYVLSKQLLRSGTSIGANIAESKEGQSGPDFISKLSISLKEAAESIYWLELLVATGFITERQGESLISDCNELRAMLTASIKTKKTAIRSKDERSD